MFLPSSCSVLATGSAPAANWAQVSGAAYEVRKGRQNGISILRVFTGLAEVLPAAKKIYGNDLVCIKSPEMFADIVRVLLKNELREP